GNLRLAVVGAPSYFARHPIPEHPRELVEHECLNWHPIDNAPPYRWEFTENGRAFSVAVPARVLSTDATLNRRLAIAGLGVTLSWPSISPSRRRASRHAGFDTPSRGTSSQVLSKSRRAFLHRLHIEIHAQSNRPRRRRRLGGPRGMSPATSGGATHFFPRSSANVSGTRTRVVRYSTVPANISAACGEPND